MGARYYSGESGRFNSQDKANLDLGSSDWESTYNRPQELFLRDPQQLNTYSYARNNPMVVTDPGGDIIPLLFGIVYAGLTAYDAYNTTQTIADPNASLGGQVLAVALFASPVGEVKAAGQVAIKAGDTVSSVLKGAEYGKLGIVSDQKINKVAGYTQHGLSQKITRGVSTSDVMNTVRNPNLVLKQSGGTSLHVSQKAVVVVNKNGKIVTTYGKKDFNSQVKSIQKQIDNIQKQIDKSKPKKK